jgi:hypothetical protein
MLGDTGKTEIDDKVGLTKNPVQLAANPSVASAAKAPNSRTFWILEDMVVGTPWARPLKCSGVLYSLDIKIVAEKISRGVHAGAGFRFLGTIPATRRRAGPFLGRTP